MGTGFRQFLSLCALSVRTMPDRKSVTITSFIGFAVTSGVLVSVFGLSAGVAALWSPSRVNDVAIIMAKGSFSELNSRLPRGVVDEISQAPDMQRKSGLPMISPQLAITQTLPRSSGSANMVVVVRGFSGEIPDLGGHLKLTSGRWFQPGKNEVVIGRGLSSSLANARIGDSVDIGGTPFAITGTFADGNSIHNSEIWGDLIPISVASSAPGQISSIYVRLTNANAFDAFSKYLGKLPAFAGFAVPESVYLEKQSGFYRKITLIPGLVIVAILGLAALLAAINTAQSSVLARSQDLATLRAIGFSGGASLLHVIFEAGLIGLLGSLFGAMSAGALFNNTSLVTSAGLNSMVVTLTVTPAELVKSIGVVLLVAMLSGVGPALALYRMRVAEALRGF